MYVCMYVCIIYMYMYIYDFELSMCSLLTAWTGRLGTNLYTNTWGDMCINTFFAISVQINDFCWVCKVRVSWIVLVTLGSLLTICCDIGIVSSDAIVSWRSKKLSVYCYRDEALRYLCMMLDLWKFWFPAVSVKSRTGNLERWHLAERMETWRQVTWYSRCCCLVATRWTL